MDSGVDSDMEEVVPLNGRCFKKLVQLVPGQYIQDSIIKMKAINTSRCAFAKMISNPKKLMEDRFEKFELDGRMVRVVPYPTIAEVYEIEDAFGRF